MDPSARLRRLGHLNLIEYCRETARWSGRDGAIEERDGLLLFATGSDFPVLVNGAFALDPTIAPADLLDVADRWFGGRGRGYTVLTGAVEGDAALAAAAEARGMLPVLRMPEMMVRAPVEERPLPAGLDLRWVDDDATRADFVAVQAGAYTTYGMPPDVVPRVISDGRAFTEPQVQSVVAYLDGDPVAGAQTVLSHGIAGVYWVGTLAEARGRGLGDAVTRAVTNRAFSLGATANSLQASSMGEAIYARMGYEPVYQYVGHVRFP